MKTTSSGLRFSASDLSGFLQCKHLTALEFARASGVGGLPEAAENYGALQDIISRGAEHEAALLTAYRDVHGWSVLDIDSAGGDPVAATVAALGTAGHDVIYQGVLEVEGAYGRPDFLIRSRLLDEDEDGYSVVDAKLARSAKASAVLQTTFYSRLLGEITGNSPKWLYLELGDGRRERLRVDDYAAYERATFARMQEFLSGRTPDYPIADPYPDKVEHCGVCRWRNVCRQRRRSDRDVSLVAGSTTRQRRLLRSAGHGTLDAVADLGAGARVEDMSAPSLEKLRLQASAQRQTTDERHPFWELTSTDEELAAQLDDARSRITDPDARHEPLRGLFALPAPSPGDLFFDLEAARFYGGGVEGFGLEYLFGIIDPLEDAGGSYVQRWAFDRADERAAFEWFVGLLSERLEKYPEMHVYHYNHYEPTALDRLSDRHRTMSEVVGELMGRFGTMEDETDHLMRNRVFVDLYPIFRQAIRAGIESYSLKQTEKVAGYVRAQPLDEADEHLLAFQRALDEGPEVARSLTATQDVIAAYNEDDCRATLRLRDWLEERRTEVAEKLRAEIPRPSAVAGPIQSRDYAETEGKLRQPLGDRLDDARVLMADLLGYEDRNAKPQYWIYYHLLDSDESELEDSAEAIVGLEHIAESPPTGRERNPRSEFRFRAQEVDIREGDGVSDPAQPDLNFTVDAIDRATGKIILVHPAGAAPPSAIVKQVPNFGKAISQNLEGFAKEVLELGSFEARPAAARLLLRDQPTLDGGAPLPSRPAATSASEHAVSLSTRVGTSYLAVQGPPGSGKTFTGAEMVLTMLAADERARVGITGPSNAVIHHFLDELHERAKTRDSSYGIAFYSSQSKKDASKVWRTKWDGSRGTFDERDRALAALASGSVRVLGGTTWLWGHPDARDTIHSLVIDEAGQFSLAHAVAAAAATRGSIVLLGDPQQLPSVAPGTHPGGSGATALGHVLADQPVIPSTHGVFLDRTRRMHDDITAFISDAFYISELDVEPSLSLDRQAVDVEPPWKGSGLRHADVEHVGNDSRSPEEAGAVIELVRALLKGRWVDRSGQEHSVTLQDIMVVTPYNAQIRCISEHLAAAGMDGLDVGTVDRFQGREAPIVIYSMATSSAEDAPRGMEFLYQLNRLNVAISRAQALAITVMSPEIVRVDCRTPRQMQLASAHCLLRERATTIPVGGE